MTRSRLATFTSNAGPILSRTFRGLSASARGQSWPAKASDSTSVRRIVIANDAGRTGREREIGIERGEEEDVALCLACKTTHLQEISRRAQGLVHRRAVQGAFRLSAEHPCA